MNKNNAVSLRTQANYLAIEAQKELNSKGHFDPHLACMNCKRSITKFLNGYLIERNVVPNEMQTMSALLRQCTEVDPAFEEIDLSAIDCRFEKVNDDHCTDKMKLNKCLEVTKNIRDLTEL